MNNYIYILSFIFICFSSCDKIEKPIPELPGAIDWNLYPGDSLDYLSYYNFNDPESNWNTNSNNKRNILLEYYTGHKCPNCPAAAVTGKDLESNTSLGVTMVSIHAVPGNGFQYTFPPDFTTDFTTEAGDIYATEIPGLNANPKGTINRIPNSNNPESEIWFSSDEWETNVNQEANQNLLANIQVQTNYFPSTNGLFIHTESEIKSNLVGDYRLIIYLIRKSVIAPQEFPNGIIEYDYDHHNVLSDNINGAWGTPIGSNNLVEESKFYNDFSYEIPSLSTDSTYGIENLSLVTYICKLDKVSDPKSFKIIQVTKTDLEP